MGVRQRRVCRRAAEGHGEDRLCRAAARAGGEARARRADGDRHLELHRDRGGRAGAMAARKIRDKARKIAAHLLEASEDDLVWEPGKFSVKGAPNRFKTIQDVAFAAYTNHPQGMEAGLEAVSYYDPPNLTYPFGSYVCVVDID